MEFQLFKKIFLIHQDEEGMRLDRWLKEKIPGVTNSFLQKALREKKIRIDDKKVSSGTHLASGQKVSCCFRVKTFDKNTNTDMTMAHEMLRDNCNMKDFARKLVIYKDDDIIALNKPSGLAVQGGSCLSYCHIDGLLDYLKFEKEERPRLVHRLDQQTSGVLVLARTRCMAAFMCQLIRDKMFKKKYTALVVGNIDRDRGIIDAQLHRSLTRSGTGAFVSVNTQAHSSSLQQHKYQCAQTSYVVLERFVYRNNQHLAFLELMPLTGRTHQLRVHMATCLHAPILGDKKYQGACSLKVEDIFYKKMHLHAKCVSFISKNGKNVTFVAPLPDYFIDNIKKLREMNKT